MGNSLPILANSMLLPKPKHKAVLNRVGQSLAKLGGGCLPTIDRSILERNKSFSVSQKLKTGAIRGGSKTHRRESLKTIKNLKVGTQSSIVEDDASSIAPTETVMAEEVPY